MESSFNIYIADSKETVGSAEPSRLKRFTGLSLGEVRMFLTDLIARDINRGDIQCLSSASQLEHVAAQGTVDIATTSTIPTPKALIQQATDTLHDVMSPHEILTTVWTFSDKTLIVVKA